MVVVATCGDGVASGIVSIAGPTGVRMMRSTELRSDQLSLAIASPSAVVMGYQHRVWRGGGSRPHHRSCRSGWRPCRAGTGAAGRGRRHAPARQRRLPALARCVTVGTGLDSDGGPYCSRKSIASAGRPASTTWAGAVDGRRPPRVGGTRGGGPSRAAPATVGPGPGAGRPWSGRPRGRVRRAVTARAAPAHGLMILPCTDLVLTLPYRSHQR